MAYIESFLHYVGVVFICGIVLLAGLFVLLFIFLLIKTIIKSKKDDFSEINQIFKNIKNYRIWKFLIYSYIFGVSFFYIIQSFNYYGKNRAYPEAKAYKIVSDISVFFFETFVASRNLYFKPQGLKIIEPYEEWQTYLLNKAFKYIPQNDGERAIWKYEYLYANYIRARTAPIDFEKLDEVNLKALINVGGHFTLYKPSAQNMIQDISSMLDLLLDGNIEDNTYKEINRYVIASLFGVWIDYKKFLYYSLGEIYGGDKWISFVNISYNWTEDHTYLTRIKKLSNLLDEAKEKLNQNKELQKFFKSHKYLYPEMMGLKVALQANLVYVDLLYKDFSCQMESLKKYLQYRKEFIIYSNVDKDYQRFNWKEKFNSEGLVESHSGVLATYYLYKICDITRNELIFKNELNFDGINSKNALVKTKTILERIER